MINILKVCTKCEAEFVIGHNMDQFNKYISENFKIIVVEKKKYVPTTTTITTT